jgi:hypothetical protein
MQQSIKQTKQACEATTKPKSQNKARLQSFLIKASSIAIS